MLNRKPEIELCKSLSNLFNTLSCCYQNIESSENKIYNMDIEIRQKVTEYCLLTSKEE